MSGPVVYLLRCADGTLYCGWTTDLERRVREHGRGTASRYTRARLPVELVGSRAVRDRSEALRCELAVKRLPREVKLELLRDAPDDVPLAVRLGIASAA